MHDAAAPLPASLLLTLGHDPVDPRVDPLERVEPKFHSDARAGEAGLVRLGPHPVVAGKAKSAASGL
jgi:hypothetical protein